jgi:hypothetical protein
LGSFGPEAVMRWRFRARSIVIGGICLTVTSAPGVLIAPANAQAQQVSGFNAFDPQWALASPYTFSGFNTGPNLAGGANQQAYAAKVGTGTMGLFVESNVRGDGFGATAGNFFGAPPALPTSRQDWFASLGDSAWRTSVVGTYKSAPDAGLLNGLYTTASFGVTNFKTDPSGLAGLTNFSAGNDAVAFTASAGVGLQLTPQISVEGSFSWTQAPSSTFR